MKHETLIESQTKYSGRVLDLRLDTVLLPNGKTGVREVVVHPGAVAVSAINDKNEILLIKQYRYAVGETIVEIPAGKLERGEDPLAAAQRELAEETGCGAKKWKLLSTFFTTPGFCDEIMYLYLAEDLYAEEKEPDDDEFIELFWIPIESALKMVRSGEINDLKTISGIMFTKLD